MSSTGVDPAELEVEAARLETAPAEDVVRWAHDRFGAGLVLAASFQDVVLVHLATRIAPGIEVVFLDTQYHFPETLEFVDRVRRRYDLNLTVTSPRAEPDDLWRTDLEGCCGVRKVEPLNRALAGRAAWMTALRRCEAPTRAGAPVLAWDAGRGLVKLNPLAAWSDDDVAAYIRRHDLPVHPLTLQGYPSIGCWPCTRPVAPGDDPRSGRWAGVAKTECGLHVDRAPSGRKR